MDQQNEDKICKKQQNPKKSKPQPTKNVLLTPYKRSWPILPPEYEKEFQNLFYSNLSLLIPKKQVKIPWSALKDIPVDQRKQIRQQHRNLIDIDINLRKSLIFGVNECTKALERNEILAVLISSNCNPEMMVNHIIRIAEKRKIAVSVVHSLKETLKELIGFSCVCLGFRKYENLDSLCKLKEVVYFLYKVKNMSVEGILENSIHLISDNIKKVDRTKCEKNRVLDETIPECTKNPQFAINVSPKNSPENLEIPASIVPTLINNIGISEVVMIVDNPEADLSNSVQIIEDRVNVECTFDPGSYLYRTSSNKRVFVPPKFECPQLNANKKIKSTDDFIAFSENDGFNEQYVPSVIKKISGNSKKNSKKRNKKTGAGTKNIL